MKINNTELKIIKDGIKRVKSGSVVNCFDFPDEIKFRSFVRNKLIMAMRRKLKSVAFRVINLKEGSLSVKAVAKIMSKEVLRNAKYDK